MKTLGALSARAATLAKNSWAGLLLVAVLFLVNTAFQTNLYRNFLANPIWLVVPAVAVLSLAAIRIYLLKNNYLHSFFASCLAILTVTFTGIIGLYPNLIPSSLDPAYSLTIFNASSSVYTLKIMTVVALLFVPVVIAYQIWVYRVFRGKLVVEEVTKDPEAY